MKNLLLLLLLANILYFLYGAIRGDEERRGEVIVEESQLGPKLQLAESPSDEAEIADVVLVDTTQDEEAGSETVVENDDAIVADTESETEAEIPLPEPRSDLQASIGRSCATLGQFDNREDATRAFQSLEQQGYEVVLRSTIGQIPNVYWVHIRDIPSTEEADVMLEELARGGFGEAYTISTDDDGLKITIGFFGKRDGAERVELQVASLGLRPSVEPRFSEGTVYFVDVAMPLGTGAQAFIGQYGEDRVALRDAATCP